MEIKLENALGEQKAKCYFEGPILGLWKTRPKNIEIQRRYSIVPIETASDVYIKRPQDAMKSAAAVSAAHQAELFSLESQNLKARPFLKWAGGKTRLLPVLRTLVARHTYRTYFEPFLGGAALFFDLAPPCAVLNDSNPELVLCYQVVRDNPLELFETLKQMPVSESDFYRIRRLHPESLPPVERAARFIYLNKTCYNGLYRVNKHGQFNTPFGRNDKVSVADQRNLLIASRRLSNAQLKCGDYSAVVKLAGSGDFVYLDPPYLPVGKFSDFKRYTKELFYEHDHVKLAESFRKLSDKGCAVLLSNSYHEKIAKLYSDFHQQIVEVPRFINCKGEGRGNVRELLVSNHPI